MRILQLHLACGHRESSNMNLMLDKSKIICGNDSIFHCCFQCCASINVVMTVTHTVQREAALADSALLPTIRMIDSAPVPFQPCFSQSSIRLLHRSPSGPGAASALSQVPASSQHSDEHV